MVTAAGDSVVRVVVRVRPPTPRELESQRPPVVQVVDDQVLVFDPEEPARGLPALQWGGTHDGPKKKGKDLTFVFDRVFAEGATQQDVFQHTTRGILDSFLQGYNCSVFAYGATGAGKTHTMLGQDGDPGIMYLTTMELYRRLEALQEENRFEVSVSYLEVYNEQIHDLLEPKGPLKICEDSTKGVVVQGLSFHQPASAKQLLEMLSQGNRSRTQHPTDANATSSRSHAIFQVFVRQQNLVPGPVQTLRVAKMSLIDLAGSERASSTHARGERLREGANINRSLLALISVLNALADAKVRCTPDPTCPGLGLDKHPNPWLAPSLGPVCQPGPCSTQGRRAHVPYRDSKLTRLLKDSLGGNCRTVMIANISPADLAYEDTYNTLKYADRAKEIRLTLKSNVVTLDCHISHYVSVCQQLRAEVAALRKKLQEYEVTAQAPSCLPGVVQCLLKPLATALGHECCGLCRPGSRNPSPHILSPAHPLHLPSSLSLLGTPSQPCTPRLPPGTGTQQDQSPEIEAQEQALERSSADQARPGRSQDGGPAKVPAQVPELSPRCSDSRMPGLILPPSPASGPKPHGDQTGWLALRVLRLAQQQYALLQVTGLLTPDLTAELETLQQLVQEADADSGAKSCSMLGPAGVAPPSQELYSEPRSPDYLGPVTRTMARRQSGLTHTLGLPMGPDSIPAPAPREPTKKKRRPSPIESDGPLAPRQKTKRQRQSSLPCPRQGLLPKPCTPSAAQASLTCHSPRLCPATIIKRRAPLGPSALQNCSPSLGLPTRDLNATFDLSEELPSLSFQGQYGPGQPCVPRPEFLFTEQGPKPASSLPRTSACKKRHPVSSSVPRGRSRIARLPSSSLKRPAGPLAIPEPPSRLKTQEKPPRAGVRITRVS
ncbi:kinesin-like protein KIF18B isoform X2 [Fukomys damarensis]|uniref:kinesin-like protein KIF18B isoform X2 n=1 Tax=Fukomys damarensis TaxID=885580 RepID=UPI00053F7145|nr:kinesin-like protein KIF18B isoform X2 [Fukomys damarensis]